MTLAAGQLAPSFTAETFRGEPIALESFRGQKVWLGFYRWASCPLCNLRVSEVLERYAAFEEAGIQPIAVFQSSPGNIAKYVGAQDPPFPIIADPDMVLYEQYGVQVSWLGMLYPRVMMRALRAATKGLLRLDLGDGPLARVPADFLVDPEGLLYSAYYGSAISDHIPFDEIDRFGADLCLDMPAAAVTP
ncbi:MAG: AhpC/TSA family protein [Alphaproteobacteria bacterium]|nr:AhpC/TSA family protein [Alphaproteobacteria bacterium]